MAKGICPNLSNPAIKAEFDELVSAVGEVLAYAIWDLNGGYGIDKAPNGEPSKLFNDLLEHYNNNRLNAIQAKAKVYGNNFKSWFGDWTSDDKTDVSKVVDNNGEPLIVYHGSKLLFLEFDIDKFGATDGGNSGVGFYFTPSKRYARTYGEHVYPVFLNSKNLLSNAEEAERMLFGGDKELLKLRIEKQLLEYKDNFSLQKYEEAVKQAEEMLDSITEDDVQEINQHDGILDRDKEGLIFEIVVKQPNQIKSIDNSGAFDIHSANIFDNLVSPTQVLSNESLDEAMRSFREQRYNFDKVLDSLRQLITNAVEARIKSILNRKIQNKTALLVPLELLLSALKNPNIDSLLTIIYCLSDIRRTMTAPTNAILRALKNLREGKDSGFSNLALIQLQLDYFGMYNSVLEEIAKNVFDSDIYKDILGAKSFELMKDMISNMRTLFAAAKLGLVELTTDLAQKTMLKYGIKDKMSRTEIEKYVSEDLITTENDTSFLMHWIGSGDKMNDAAARVVFDIVANANNKIRFNTHKFGNRLLRLLNEVALGDQMRLFEYDKNGKKTGYLIRDRKYGEFLNNLEVERKRLKTKYLVPEGMRLPLDKKDRTEFNKEMNEWLSNNCERRYTKKYYDAFNSLSQESRDARDAIQFKIYKLLDEVRDNKGKVHLEDLDAKQWAMYENYNILKKLLMSMYYEDGTPKVDSDKEIAQELTELSKNLHEGMHYVINQLKFNEAKTRAKKELTPEQYKAWKKRYTRVEIDPKFYEQLAQLEKKKYGDRYVELKKIREEITKPYRNDYTGGYDVKYMSNTLLSTIRSIDREMRKERKLANKKSASKEDTSIEGLLFEDFAESVPTEQYKLDKAAAAAKGMEYYELWEAQHHVIYHIGEMQKVIPNWYYTKVVPKDKTLINEEAPTREFSEIDEKSEYFNNKFDPNIDEYYQPKESMYKNKEYYELFKPKKDEKGEDVATKNIPLWNLYKGIIGGMEESNDKITFLTRNNPYVLPQMSGSMYQYMLKGDGIIKGFLQHTRQGVVKDTDDVGFVDAPTSRPDGSALRMIPTYYINKLDDPNQITNDLVGSVIAYYKMAENFKQKTEILPDLEVIKLQLASRTYTGKPIGKDLLGRTVYKKGNEKQGKDTRTYLFVNAFIDMHEYGESTKSIMAKFSEDSRIAKFLGLAGKELNWSKVINGIRSYGLLIGLGLNLAVGVVGGITAFLQLLGFAANGRYFDFSSVAKAYYTMVRNLFGIVHYMHGTTTDNKYVALMQRFEVGTEFQNAWRNSNRIGILNTVSRNWAFGLFSISDFIIKGTILNSIMNNYRYFNGRFYNSQLFNELFSDKENAKNIWSTLLTSYDIVSIRNGNIVIEDKAQAKAFAEIQNLISNSARTLSAVADGQLTEELKAQLSANAFGSLVMMFRNYIPSIISERVTMKKQYDYNTGMLREALYRTIGRVVPMLLKDWSSRKQLDASDKGNIKQFTYELAMVTLITNVVKPLLVLAADEDKDNWAKNLLALLVTRAGFEYANQYNPLDLLNTITSVSSIFDIMNPFTNILSAKEMINVATDSTLIKYGPYKGNTKAERWLWKMTPFKNIKEIQDPALKRKYYEQMYK